MSEDKKTIVINPELFQFTKSRRNKNASKKIVPKIQPHNITVRKGKRMKTGAMLSYFRKTQNELLKNLDLRDKEEGEHATAKESASSFKESEFEKSVKFLKAVCSTPSATSNNSSEDIGHGELSSLDSFPNPVPSPLVPPPPPSFQLLHSQAVDGSSSFQGILKTKPFSSPSVYEIQPNIQNNPAAIPNVVTIQPFIPPPMNSSILISPAPPYGILKNGTLPTYKKYMKNMTFNQHNPISNYRTNTVVHQPQNYIVPSQPPLAPPPFMENASSSSPSYSVCYPPPSNIQKKLKKTTYKFHTGKDLKKGICSVLVPNQSAKDQIIKNTKSLKQTNMKDIKKYLLKRDLIKSGTTAPNDVLRTMYETANLICGELENHDKDIMLHNFINDEK